MRRLAHYSQIEAASMLQILRPPSRAMSIARVPPAAINSNPPSSPSSFVFSPDSILVLVVISPRTLDDGLDGFLDCVPVTGVNACQMATKVVTNLLELFPGLLVVEQADGNADASKTPGTADSV